MGTKHKHYEVIVAWAAGEEIEVLHPTINEWITITSKYPSFVESEEYRIKPKRVKKEGWLNVYRTESPDFVALVGGAFETQEKAKKHKSGEPVACIRIEWEEEA